MKVFVTGATGLVGTAVVKELINAGHDVLGLARSEASAQKLTDAGAQVHRGDLEDLESLRSGAAAADGVIHTGFIHDFSRFAEVCEVDRKAIEAMGDVLAGSNKPFIVTSGNAIVSPSVLATEDMDGPHDTSRIPRVSESTGLAFVEKGVRAMVIRLSPSVHGEGDIYGFVPMMIKAAREKGVAAYVGDGQNRWNAVHVLDAALLYRLALENGEAGARYHAVGDEAITFKTITEAIGKGLHLPVASLSPQEAAGHFGWLSNFAAIDCPASSKITQLQLNWQPVHASLTDDLAGDIYFK